MPEVLLKVREQNDERALAFAEKHKDTGFHMCVGAGNTWGETYCFAMCVFGGNAPGFLPNPFMRQNFSTALWR